MNSTVKLKYVLILVILQLAASYFAVKFSYHVGVFHAARNYLENISEICEK